MERRRCDLDDDEFGEAPGEPPAEPDMVEELGSLRGTSGMADGVSTDDDGEAGVAADGAWVAPPAAGALATPPAAGALAILPEAGALATLPAAGALATPPVVGARATPPAAATLASPPCEGSRGVDADGPGATGADEGGALLSWRRAWRDFENLRAKPDMTPGGGRGDRKGREVGKLAVLGGESGPGGRLGTDRPPQRPRQSRVSVVRGGQA